MPGATTTRQRHAVRAKEFPGDFQHVKIPAAFAGGIGVCLVFRIHALPKLSAIAMDLRIAMDLLIVS